MAREVTARSRPRIVPDSTAESLAVMEHAAAMDRVGEALLTVANEMALTRKQSKPMHDFFVEATDAVVCFRKRMRKWGMWALASTPLILTLVGGLSPNMAKFIATIISRIGH